MQYIRHGNWFVLSTTEGRHAFKQQERNQIRDCRRPPIRFEGYSISYRRSPITPKGGGEPKRHACVRIDGPTYKQLPRSSATSEPQNTGTRLCLYALCRYTPVRRQLLNILRAINNTRSKQGFDELKPRALKLRRAVVQPFVRGCQ